MTVSKSAIRLVVAIVAAMIVAPGGHALAGIGHRMPVQAALRAQPPAGSASVSVDEPTPTAEPTPSPEPTPEPEPTPPPLTDAQREQRRAADRAFVQQAVEQLRSSDGWQRWLTTRRHFHTYSLRNQLLLAMQNPDATRVAGFKAWLALGYCVRRGEKALRIFAPCPPSKAKLQAWRDAGADPAEKPRSFFRLTAVFDALSRESPERAEQRLRAFDRGRTRLRTC